MLAEGGGGSRCSAGGATVTVCLFLFIPPVFSFVLAFIYEGGNRVFIACSDGLPPRHMQQRACTI